jgi:hypothetical protein
MSDPQRRQFAAVCYIRHHDVDIALQNLVNAEMVGPLRYQERRCQKDREKDQQVHRWRVGHAVHGQRSARCREDPARVAVCGSRADGVLLRPGFCCNSGQTIDLHGQQMTLENRLPLTLWVQMAM